MPQHKELARDHIREKVWRNLGRDEEGFDSLRWKFREGGGPREGITCTKVWGGKSVRDGLRDNGREMC